MKIKSITPRAFSREMGFPLLSTQMKFPLKCCFRSLHLYCVLQSQLILFAFIVLIIHLQINMLRKKFEFQTVQAKHRPIAFWMSLTNRGWNVGGFILLPLMVYLME
jgi:hypothetical protein